jgi:hypothetical protein
MPIPPILDVFVIWHPADTIGAQRFGELYEHFHSPSFSGLVGGAVEVYERSVPWTADGAPRPLGIDALLAKGLPAAQINAIVPVFDTHMLQAVQDPNSGWKTYVEGVLALNNRPNVGVYPIKAPGLNWSTSSLGHTFADIQTLPEQVNSDSGLLGREVAQSITQKILQDKGSFARLKVFVSHTKRRSLKEMEDTSGNDIVESVREGIRRSHLASFFDAQDIQPGSEWRKALHENASTSALLMIRTDLYASREWTQQEVLDAKQNGMPVVSMHAFTSGEERGSFLMDHIPSVVCDIKNPAHGIDLALNRLVDEALKSTLWGVQTSYLSKDGFDWLPAQSPEPITLIPWLKEHKMVQPEDRHLWAIHPDPPLGPSEEKILVNLCALSGYDRDVDILTPRTFAARGGALKKTVKDPTLIERQALDGQRIALSVSASADLERLGLTEEHCKLVVAEISRAIMLAGGTVVYGGNLDPNGYTRILFEEAQRFGGGRPLFENVLAESEYSKETTDDLKQVQRKFAEFGRLKLISSSGRVVEVEDLQDRRNRATVPESLTAMRQYVTNNTDARIIVGGKLEGFQGRVPGVIEEAQLTIQARHPLLVSGGYGGASAAIAKLMRPIDFTAWTPSDDFPHGIDDVVIRSVLSGYEEMYKTVGGQIPHAESLDEKLLHQLTISHRPADIATATVQLLSQLCSS